MDGLKNFMNKNKLVTFGIGAIICLSINMVYFADIWCLAPKDFWSNTGIILLKVFLMFNIVMSEALF